MGIPFCEDYTRGLESVISKKLWYAFHRVVLILRGSHAKLMPPVTLAVKFGLLVLSFLMELTILMPCLDEAETIRICISKAKDWMLKNGIDGEVLVADNGSSDGSQRLAEEVGARVIPVATRGYGAALQQGIKSATGKWIIMGDADTTVTISLNFPHSTRSFRKATNW